LYNDEVAKKKRAARPALRTSARRLRATLLPFALPSFVAERVRSMRQRDAIDAGGEEPEPYPPASSCKPSAIFTRRI
jgi:hypothetical protein